MVFRSSRSLLSVLGAIFLVALIPTGANASQLGESASLTRLNFVELRQGMWCQQAALRFPGSDTPRVAVTDALRKNGRQIVNNPYAAAYLHSADQVVGGWLAVSLQRNRLGYQAPTLAEWVAEGRTMGFSLTLSEWNDMLAWEPDSCEGLFVNEPTNDYQMSLMRALVNRTG